MRRRAEITVTSELEAGAEAVWARAIDPEGINYELRPLMRMTVPRGAENFGLDDLEPGHIGRSWIFLFGLVPCDYDDLNIVRVEPGRSFLERSTMLSMRLWEHERTIEPLGDGRCQVEDRLAWEPRLPLPGAWLRPVVRFLFNHRHGRLRRCFGAAAAS